MTRRLYLLISAAVAAGALGASSTAAASGVKCGNEFAAGFQCGYSHSGTSSAVRVIYNERASNMTHSRGSVKLARSGKAFTLEITDFVANDHARVGVRIDTGRRLPDGRAEVLQYLAAEGGDRTVNFTYPVRKFRIVWVRQGGRWTHATQWFPRP